MADISKITLPSGTTYNIKDTTARQSISDIQSSITGAMHYSGVTTTALTDGSTTATLTIDEASATFTASDAGSVVIYGEKEYVWNGTKWQEFGSTGSLKALAFKDSASASYKPAGTVSKPIFTGNEMTSTGSYTPAGSVNIVTTNETDSGGELFYITPVTAVENQPQYIPTGTVTLTPTSNTTYPRYYIQALSGIVSGQPTYTPSGNVTLTLTPNTVDLLPITDVGSLPNLTATVANETLSLGWDAGELPTAGTSTAVVTGFSKKTATFTGNPTSLATANLKPEFAGTKVSLRTDGYIKATFSGTSKTVSVKGTPNGTVSQPTFTGTQATITSS